MTRSPCGSADNEHKAKRSQHQPPLLDGSSTPSALSMPSLTSLPQCQASADNASQDTQAMSVSSPTVINWKTGSRAQELEKASKPQDSVKLEAVRQDAPAPDTAETVSVEHARLESLFTEKRQSREAEADAMRAQWPQDMMESWRHEKLALELRIIDAEAEQDRNSEASKIMQKFQAGQLRGLRATLSQVQAVHPTLAPQSATQEAAVSANKPQVAPGTQ
ncbi:hypothetical protein PI126_g23498 [Phytophthora idaei]|nr:hypothetical protein PI126_g23498 [Phytophthora idaei]